MAAVANDGTKQAQYLPTYYGKNVNALGPGYDIRGLRDPGPAIASAGQQVAQSGVELGHSIQQLAQTYYKVVDMRHARDEEVRAETYFRERRLVESQLEGEDADGLYFNNKEGMQKAQDDFLKDSPLRSDRARDIFNAQAEKHLDWSMNHMLRQAKVAEKLSKKKAAGALVRGASEAPLSVEAIADIQRRSEQLYADEPELANTLKTLATRGLINARTAQNPSATVNWAHNNREQLNQQMGADEAAKFVESIEKTARKNEARIAANQARYNKLKQAQKNQITRELKSLAAGWVREGKPFNEEEFMQFANERGIDEVGIREAQDYYYKLGEVNVKRDSNYVAANLMYKEGDITDAEWGYALDACGRGEITLSTCNNIEKRYKMQNEATKGEISEQTKIANKALVQAAGGSLMQGPLAAIMGSNTSDTPLSLQAQQKWIAATKGMSQQEVIAAADLQDPNSLLSRLVRQVTEQTDAQASTLKYVIL